jgi:hypothetical protein
MSHVQPGADCRSSAPCATYLRRSNPPNHRSSACSVTEQLCARVSAAVVCYDNSSALARCVNTRRAPRRGGGGASPSRWPKLERLAGRPVVRVSKGEGGGSPAPPISMFAQNSCGSVDNARPAFCRRAANKERAPQPEESAQQKQHRHSTTSLFQARHRTISAG